MPVASTEFLFQIADRPGTAEGQEGTRRTARTGHAIHTGCSAHAGRANPSSCGDRTGHARYAIPIGARDARERTVGTPVIPGTCTDDTAGYRAARGGAGATRVGAMTGRLLEFFPPVIGASQPGLQR